MILTCWETPDSRSITLGVDHAATLRFMVQGTTSHSLARMQLLVTAPLLFNTGQGNLVRETPKLEPAGLDLWDCTVEYAPTTPQEGQIEWEFEIGTEQVKMTHSLEHMGAFPSPGYVPTNFKGAIGVTESNGQTEIEGVMVDVPIHRFALRARMDPVKFNPAYYQNLATVKNSPVNLTPFYGFLGGEVKFDGVSGGYKQGEEYGEMQFQFSAQPNMEGLTVATIGGVKKDGWDYSWVFSEEDVIPTEGGPARKGLVPKVVYIERVYRRSNFVLLGIGGT